MENLMHVKDHLERGGMEQNKKWENNKNLNKQMPSEKVKIKRQTTCEL